LTMTLRRRRSTGAAFVLPNFLRARLRLPGALPSMSMRGAGRRLRTRRTLPTLAALTRFGRLLQALGVVARR